MPSLKRVWKKFRLKWKPLASSTDASEPPRAFSGSVCVSFSLSELHAGGPLYAPNTISQFIASGNGFLWLQHVDGRAKWQIGASGCNRERVTEQLRQQTNKGGIWQRCPSTVDSMHSVHHYRNVFPDDTSCLLANSTSCLNLQKTKNPIALKTDKLFCSINRTDELIE